MISFSVRFLMMHDDIVRAITLPEKFSTDQWRNICRYSYPPYCVKPCGIGGSLFCAHFRTSIAICSARCLSIRCISLNFILRSDASSFRLLLNSP